MENSPNKEELVLEQPQEQKILQVSNFYKKIIFCIFGLGILLFVSLFLFLSPPDNFPKDSILSIEEGVNLRKLSLKLQTENIIRSRIAFETLVILYEGEKHIIPGDYLLDGRLPTHVIAHRISKGDHRLPPIKITIPEGFDVEQIGNLFAEKMTNFSLDKFLLQARSKEGYLFPDTYFFTRTDDEENVLKYLGDNFNKKIAPILPEINSFGKTKEEIIIMASIIEREAKGDTDRGVIAGILWKRISIGIALQVDAAPITYKEKGLPKDPISNPGLASIKATINPVSTAYLYYLHDREGNIHYARNFEEHKSNIAKYLK